MTGGSNALVDEDGLLNLRQAVGGKTRLPRFRRDELQQRGPANDHARDENRRDELAACDKAGFVACQADRQLVFVIKIRGAHFLSPRSRLQGSYGLVNAGGVAGFRSGRK